MKCILEIETSISNYVKVSVEPKKMFSLIKKYIPSNCIDPDVYIESMKKLLGKQMKLICVKSMSNSISCLSNGII